MYSYVCHFFRLFSSISLCTSTFRQNAISYLVYILWAMQHSWYSLVNRVFARFFSRYLLSQKISPRSELRQFWEKRTEKALDRWQWKCDVPKLSFQTIQKRNRLKIRWYRRYGKHGQNNVRFSRIVCSRCCTRRNLRFHVENSQHADQKQLTRR